jgi:hypothetical protein
MRMVECIAAWRAAVSASIASVSMFGAIASAKAAGGFALMGKFFLDRK